MAFAYALAVVVLFAVLAVLPRSTHDAIVLGSSTNLDNLRHRPLAVLFASAFVLSNVGGLWQIPLLLWAYGAVERWLGPTATVVVGVLGHVGATLFVATILVTGIERGLFSRDLIDVTDVGVSYGLAAVGGLLVVRVPRRHLLLYLSLVSAFLLTGLLGFRSYTELGHVTAFGIGLALSQLVRRAANGTARLS